MTQKRAAVYVRVSTEAQRREGSSLKTQKEKCLEYVTKNGFALAVEPIEDTISGAKPIFDRPGGRELKRWIDASAIDAAVMFTSDRMSRDDSGIDYLLLRSYLLDHGVELHFCDTGLDRDDFAGKVVSSVHQLLASEERHKIAERTKRGRIDRANGGKVFYAGRILYGYKREGKLKDSRIAIDPEQADIVRSVFQSYNKGLMNLREIAIDLNDKGIPTPRHGKAGWTEGTCKRILDNISYTGVWQYRDVSIPAPELKIVDRSTYDAAQERREKNKETAHRHQRREYLLSGHLFCTCGRRMCGSSEGGANIVRCYYSCNHRGATIPDCYESRMRADKADPIVWGWIEQQLDRKILERGIDDMIARKEKEVAPAKERLSQVADLIGKTDKRIVRLVAEMADIDDDEARAAVKDNVRQLTRQKAGLIQERDTLLQRVNDIQITPETKQAILETVENARKQLHGATFKQKRFIMKKLDARVQLRYDESGRWLDVTCGVRPEGTTLPIDLRPS